jgi:hypothetical protein
MATLATQTFNTAPAGKAITFASAAGGGDKAQPGDRVFLLVRNGSGSSINVTLDSTGVAFNATAVGDTVVAVADGAEKLIPIRREYASPVDGLAGISYSAVTTVTVAVLAF